MASSAVRRGRNSETYVAEYFKAHGWPLARRVPASYPGRDVVNTRGVAPEVKARRNLDIVAWLKQAVKNRGEDYPLLVFRPIGYGEASIEEWPAVMPLKFLVELLHEAGYGVPEDPDQGNPGVPGV